MVIDPWFHPFNGTVSTRRFVTALKTRFDFRMLIAEGLTIRQTSSALALCPWDFGINFILDRMKAPWRCRIARLHR